MSRQRVYLALLIAALVVGGAVGLWWFQPEERVARMAEPVGDHTPPAAVERPADPVTTVAPAETPATTPSEGPIETAPIVELSVVVLLPDGSVAPDADVHWQKYGAETVSRAAFTPPALKVSVGRARWIVGARRGTGNDALEVEIDVESEDHIEDPRVELSLRPALGGVTGRLLPPTGFSRLPRYAIELERDPASSLPKVSSEMVAKLHNQPAQPANGAFTFLHQKPGRYRLVAFGSEGEVLATAEVNVDRTVQTIDLRMADLNRPGHIIVRVYGPGGTQMDDVWFGFGMGSASLIADDRFEPLQADDGSYWFPRVVTRNTRSYSEPAGRYDITANSAKFGKRHVPYAISDTHEVEIRFEPIAWATITVANAANHLALDKVSWGLRPGPNQPRYSSARSWRLEPGATSFRLGPVQPMEYTLVHWCKSSGNAVFELGLTPLKLAPGENSMSIEIPPVYVVTVTFDPARKEKVQLSAPDTGRGLGFQPFEPQSGETAIGPLPAGIYKLNDDKSAMTFELPAQTAVHFNPPVYDAWAITGVVAGGRIEAMGLREGDIIVAIDGVEITDANLPETSPETVLAKAATMWTILREGATIAVTVNGPQLRQSRMRQEGQPAERLLFKKTYRGERR